MKNKILSLSAVALIVVLLFSFIAGNGTAFAQGEWLSFTGSPTDINSKPVMEFNDMGMAGVEIDYFFPGAEVTTKEVEGTTYHYVHVDQFGKLGDIGKAALPMRNYTVAVPSGAEIHIEILQVETQVYEGYLIHPALEPALDEVGAPEPDFVIDEDFYKSEQNYPESPARVVATNMLRGIPLAQVQVCPVQYNPGREELTVYSRLKFRVEFVGGEGVFLDPHAHSSRFIQLLKNVVINGESIPATEQEADAEGGIIIITHSDYLAAANTLAEWKRQMGYTVEVVSQASWTTTQVRNAISTRYNSWSPRPDYFIIIGDHGDVPAQALTLETPHVSDLYYACMDGAVDYFPDMAHGRISVSSADEANTVISKIVNYQRTPPTDASFYANATTCALFQDRDDDGYADRRFSLTSEEIRDHLISEGYTVDRIYDLEDNSVVPRWWNNGLYATGAAIPPELLKPGFPWTGSTTDIINSVDAGRFILFHRDHGYVGGSGWATPYFTTANIPSLANGDELPVVFSINCHTGEFDLANCFAEMFLRHSNSGAVGLFAASDYSLSGQNDGLAEGFIDAIWPGLVPLFPHNPSPTYATHAAMYEMGMVLNQGKIRMTETWDSSGPPFSYEQYTFELFHYFGDPSMRIWTAAPTTITATHDSQITLGQTSFTISDVNCSSGVATLYYNGQIIGKGTLASGGTIAISPTPTTAGTAELTITSHNYRPYQTNINVVSDSGAYVVYNAHTVNDTAGNNNSQVDTGESILLGMTLKNTGASSATSVSAVLSTSDPYITITDSTQSWGTIGAGATSNQSDAFAFNVANNIPDQHEVDFSVAVTGTGETTWNSSFSITVNAPVLAVGSMTIDDSGGNNDGVLDPGETVNVLVGTSNDGNADAASTTATLTCSSGYITINTGTHNFGTLAAGGSDTASFNISVVGGTPVGTSVNLDYAVTSGSYSAPKSFPQEVGLTEVQVGTDTSAVALPFHTSYMDTRTQTILLASEIGQGGTIQKLKLYCSTRPGQDLKHFYIRMQHTAMASFPSTSFVNTGWTTCLHATDVDVSSWTVPGWVEFELTTPFAYNGTSHLLIDYCFDNTSYSSDGACHSTVATDRTLYLIIDLSGTNLLNYPTGTKLSSYQNVKLTIGGAGSPSPSLNSYSDTWHNIACPTFSDYGTEHTLYIHGTGFETGFLQGGHQYRVAYYDGGNTKRATEDVLSDSSGELSSQHTLVPGTDVDGTWHVIVCERTQTPPSSYNPAWAHTLATATFTVDESAIPEFPTVTAAIVAFSLCVGVYLWMRRKTVPVPA